MVLNAHIKYLNWGTILNKNDSIFISIVIPVYNEEESLPQLMAEIDEIVKKASFEIEVIFVNDVSIGTMGELHPEVRRLFELEDRPVICSEIEKFY